MTIEDIRAMKDDFITPATAGAVMRMSPGRVIEYARTGQLPFKVVLSGNRVKIGRGSFLNWIEGKQDHEAEAPDAVVDKLSELVKVLHEQNVAQTAQNAMLLALLMELSPGIENKVRNIIMKAGGPAQ